MQPKTLTDEEIVREFLAKHSEDNYVTSEEEAAFNRLMINMRKMQILEAGCKTSALDHAYNQGIDDAKSQADDMFEEDKLGVGCVYIGDVGEAILKLKKEPRHD